MSDHSVTHPGIAAETIDEAPVAVFDGHNDTLLKLELEARGGRLLDFAGGAGGIDIDLPRARASGFAGGLFAMYTPSRPERYEAGRPRRDEETRYDPVDQPAALAFTLALFARMRRLAEAAPDRLAICLSAAEARAAMAAGRLAMVPHVEGAECIDPDLNALEVLHAAGLRSLGLVWSRPNQFGHGAPMARQDEPEPGEGLTEAGRRLVARAEELGIMVDLSHLNPAGFWEVAKMATKPLVASHSNAHALSPNARNLTDRQLDAIAESGGLVGLNFHVAFLRPDCATDRDTPLIQMLRHLDHLIERLGEDGVALGSDYDGCELPAEIGDVTGLPRLIAAMRQAGYGEALIAKIARENWLAALERAAG
ncbi:dipeptidase [Paralimibaculum aggregatum]|uniref:Dipeptidase n=1 Tax=Paralimibaculum aggregatum TaxID=3036245 RepID=A0ABQ6LN54_9RHOB|nr:dipeptidase [Limibaculum sp. NKW23]GMG81861.1 dipeptidase [Limibaculum sp. NKW23]